ncbi:hypothetical protein [Ralstonia solanacearum]|uniref:hypothetical protein n=1 Tax=Ralstonia solanacearum TaxID=305 RepID=UPI001868AE69|nr:hypothetical protein [Ralstonia solanacearum]QOK80895.1 hypothetical protein HF906_01090 [Ralstonia solanacearum]
MSRNHRGQGLGNPVTRSLPAPAGGVQLETFVPWTLVKRGSKKRVITPLDAPQAFTEEARQENEDRQARRGTPLLRTLGLAHYWQRLLAQQRVASVAEIAEAEDINVTQVRRILRLTLLAPSVIEQLLNMPEANLESTIRRTWPANWYVQAKQVADVASD